MQINIEANEIRALGAQEFSGRIISERAEALWVHSFGLVDKIIYEIGNRPGAAPANDVRRNLIGDAVGEHRRMPSASENATAHRIAGCGSI